MGAGKYSGKSALVTRNPGTSAAALGTLLEASAEDLENVAAIKKSLQAFEKAPKDSAEESRRTFKELMEIWDKKQSSIGPLFAAMAYEISKAMQKFSQDRMDELVE